ncbi:MAG: hypothetical protein QXP71_02945 [Desulfurococcaceae archaeon]
MTTNIFYEETGYRPETIWIKKSIYTVLTIIPFSTSLMPIFFSDNMIAILLVLISIFLYITGCYKLNTLLTYISILFAFIVQKIFLNIFNLNFFILNTIWIFLSEYFVELILREKTFIKINVRKVSLIYTLQVIAILIAYIILAIFVAHVINYTYDQILNSTPMLLQLFYRIFIETRIGAIIFIVLIVYLTYLFMNEYIYGLINDLLFTTKKYVLDYARDFVYKEYEIIVNNDDSFNKIYRMILYSIVYMFLFPFFYILVEIFNLGIQHFILLILINLGISYVIYYIINQFIKRFMNIEPTISKPTNGSLLFKISLVFLIVYLFPIFYYSPQSSLDILFTAIGLNKPNSTRTSVFSNLVTNAYIELSRFFYDIMEKYVLYLTRTYNELLYLLEIIIRFIWG